MRFKQISKLTTNNKGEVEVNSYEWEFVVNLKGNSEKTSTVYNKELKMYFENPAGFMYLYEVEFTKVKLDLCKRLKKSTNFNRKLFYRYDFIQAKVNSKGQVISIENKEELRNVWYRLKSKMEVDHKGTAVEEYLEGIDSEFTTDKNVYPVMTQYLQFGLLFFNIPKLHSANWSGKRLIEFSPYEREQFEEITTIAFVDDHEITYKIKGNALPDNKTQIQKYEGTAIKGQNENFVRKIDINTSIIKGNIVSEWNFSLHRIN